MATYPGALKRCHKPIVCNEDDKQGEPAAHAAELSVANYQQILQANGHDAEVWYQLGAPIQFEIMIRPWQN
jgi:hypothetical protein